MRGTLGMKGLVVVVQLSGQVAAFCLFSAAPPHAFRISRPTAAAESLAEVFQKETGVVRSEKHVVKTIWSVWVRIGGWPTVVPALLYVNEFVRRMVVNVGGNQFPIVDRSAALPTVVERVENVIGFVDRGPKLIRTRDKS